MGGAIALGLLSGLSGKPHKIYLQIPINSIKEVRKSKYNLLATGSLVETIAGDKYLINSWEDEWVDTLKSIGVKCQI